MNVRRLSSRLNRPGQAAAASPQEVRARTQAVRHLKFASLLLPLGMYSLALYGSLSETASAGLILFYPLAVLLCGITLGQRGLWAAAVLAIATHLAAQAAQSGEWSAEFALGAVIFSAGMVCFTAVQSFLMTRSPGAAARAEEIRHAAEQQKILNALHTNELLLRTLVSNAPIILWSINQHGIITVSEGKTLNKLGFTPGEIVGRSFFEVYKDYPQVIESVIKSLAGEPTTGLAEIDGLIFDMRYTPLTGDDGEITGVIGVSIDVTDHKLAEKQVEQQFRRLSGLHEIDNAIINNLDKDSTLRIMLEQVTEQLAIDAADILLLGPGDQSLHMAAARGFRTLPYELQNHCCDCPGQSVGEGYAGLIALFRQKIYIPGLAEHRTEWIETRHSWEEEGFTSYIGLPLVSKGQVKGVLELFTRSPIRPNTEWLNYLTILAGQVAIAIDNSTLFEDLQQSNKNLSLAYDLTLEGWARALELRDKETEGHSQRVLQMTLDLAKELGLTGEALVHIRRGALLHDIGKMGIPDSILLKPGPLTEAEWMVMRKHPVFAHQLLSPVPFLHPAIDIPYCHHERWDGSGYPRGLKEEEIPLAARIFSVIDAWDALHDDRPYRKAWPEEQVKSYLREQAGKCFDPAVVKAFFSLLKKQ
jgi:PAS domain S-box-containing protein